METIQTIEVEDDRPGSDHERVERGPERPGERVEADLRRRIESGEWDSGQALPTVSALARHYRVSPGVIQRAEKRLEDEGLIRIVARWGVFRR